MLSNNQIHGTTITWLPWYQQYDNTHENEHCDSRCIEWTNPMISVALHYWNKWVVTYHPWMEGLFLGLPQYSTNIQNGSQYVHMYHISKIQKNIRTWMCVDRLLGHDTLSENIHFLDFFLCFLCFQAVLPENNIFTGNIR